MRIANIIEEGKLGGPQVRICAVADALKGQAETTVIMPRENSQAFQLRCEAHGVVYKVLRISRITKEWKVAVRYVLFFFFEVWRIAQILRRGGFDLVHVSGGSWQIKGIFAAKLAGKRVLWHLNDTSMPGIIRRVFSFLSCLADGYIFASERSRTYYGPLIRESKPEFVIQAPVDTATFDPAREYPGDESVIGSWNGKVVIGTVANINPVKGLDLFIRMAAALNAKFDNLVFVVIGQVYRAQERYFEQLNTLCERESISNIEFVGARSDVRPLLKRFDAYVCSSRAESSPISVWEAMSLGKAIVSTDVGDVPLYVKDGRSGFVVDSGDWHALADRIGRYICDAELRRSFGQKARDIAINYLDINKCAQGHLDAYAYMLGR